ncbi:MAG: hypothetical protein J7M32_07410, partial [Deltaproteobacteria bacterium]|nr:hypothetical protein [Deltaproteobacteria bacterium]
DPRDESLGKNAQLALAGGCPPQISHSRDQPGGPERKNFSSAPGLRRHSETFLYHAHDLGGLKTFEVDCLGSAGCRTKTAPLANG